MSHFTFEQQLSDAARFDTSIHVSAVSRQSLKPSSRSNLSGLALNRSRSASRLSPNHSLSKGRVLNKSKSPARSKTPTRMGILEVSQRNNGADRFIPSRSATDMEYASHSLRHTDEDADSQTAAQQDRRKLMEEMLNIRSESRILSFNAKAPSKDGHVSNNKVVYSASKPSVQKASNTRQIASSPEKILDAPDMINDFYLHLMDWSSLNHMAVALSAGVYIWNATDGSIMQLCQREQEEEYVSSVSWIKEGNVLAIGDSEGCVQLWDVANTKCMRTMAGHTDRVSTLDWNSHILASGGREGEIHLHDVRVAEHRVQTLRGHTQEVCGLVWSPDGRLLASGGNDNIVQLWEVAGARNTSTRPLHTITEHQSAVKAVSWCPWQPGVLATAGGTVDRTIRMWNTASMNQLHCLDTGSQVSSIVWNTEYKELITGHGFSQNQLTVWKYPSLAKVADLTGHTSRVLLLAVSPDGSTVASVAADETIRLWKVWPPCTERKKSTSRDHPVSKLAQSIR